VPRWEFRIFARRLPDTIPSALLAGETLSPASREIYLLSSLTTENIKVRHNTLEIKHLLRRSAEGFERWTPTLKATFPLDPASFAGLLRALGVSPKGPERRWGLATVLRRLIDPDPRLRSVRLTKRRARLSGLPCTAERVTLRVSNWRWQSFALEGPDLSALRAAVRALDLDPIQNLNYPRALKRLLGIPEMPSHLLTERS
jgi:hypothetical protein